MPCESCLNSPPPRPVPTPPRWPEFPRPPLRGILLLFAHTQTIPHSHCITSKLSNFSPSLLLILSFRPFVHIAACNKSGRKFHEIRALFSERREVKIGREDSFLPSCHDDQVSLPPMGGLLMCFAFPKIGFAICEGFVVGGARRNRLGILLHPWVTECTTPNLDSHT